MEKLRRLAFEKRIVIRQTVKGEVKLEGLKIHFPCASLLQVKKSKILENLSDNTYLSKPVVTIDKETVLFGELAILKYLEKDGWKGVWVDAFHSSKGRDVLWSGMPPKGTASPLSPKVLTMFNSIKDKNGGKLSGFFDILAWKGDGDAYLFVEYKGRNDSPNENELNWINAAVSAGVKPDQLIVVGYDLPV